MEGRDGTLQVLGQFDQVREFVAGGLLFQQRQQAGDFAEGGLPMLGMLGGIGRDHSLATLPRVVLRIDAQSSCLKRGPAPAAGWLTGTFCMTNRHGWRVRDVFLAW